MTKSFTSSARRLAALAFIAASAAAHAHITLPPGGATAGTEYDAAFRVGHACKDASSTSGVTVSIPAGFIVIEARPRAGWTLDVQRGAQAEVRWSAENAATALPAAERAEFIVRGKLTQTPGTLYFKVLQSCDNGSASWAQLPAATGDKLEYPAARLDVLPPGIAPVDIKDAWVRPTVPGQSGTGVFMKLNAPSGLRLVGASTPAAGNADVHEMKMEGDVMKMRPVQGGLELPSRQTVELKPSGYHLMLTDLKQTLAAGSSVPLTLRFVDAAGVRSTLELSVVVGMPPDMAAGTGGHMH